MARERDTRGSAHDAGAYRCHLLVDKRKGCRPDGVSVELFKTFKSDLVLCRRLLDHVVCRDANLACEPWVRCFHILLIAQSQKLDPNIAEGLDQWPENVTLGVQPTMQELTGATCSLTNGKAVDRTKSPLSSSISLSNAVPSCAVDCSITSFVFGRGGGDICGAEVERCHHHGIPRKEGSERA